GGMYNLARALEKLMEELEIEVHLDSEIKGLNHENGEVNSARIDGGETVEADVYVSNMEVIPTYRELTGEDDKFMQKYEKFEPACSGLVLHLGVEKQFEQLAHHNFFFSRDPEKHFEQVFRKKVLPEDPTIYLVAPSRTNPAVAPAGCDNIKVLPHIPHLQDNSFTEEEYKKLEGRVLDKLERMGLEGLRENTVVEDTWTPEDIREMYYSNGGAIYGVVSDKTKNLGFKAPKESDRYNNLYFVGGSVNPGGGMPMVVLSGQRAAEEIRRKYG
ncbi:MAG: phytoene desaturase family protein, partial [bacterium]